MSDTFEEVKAVIADVLKIDPSEITPRPALSKTSKPIQWTNSS